jgi:Co/Zn/Cd efflux system component
VKGTFEALVGSLVVMNTLVATDWHWVVFDPVYQLVLETFVKDLVIGLAYRAVTEVMEWARNRVRFPRITFSMLLV